MSRASAKPRLPRRRQAKARDVAKLPPQLGGAGAGAAVAVVQDHLRRLRQIGDHPNRVLHYDQLLAAHLIGFYDPVVRSLRTLDARTVTDAPTREALDQLRLARSTISDAMNELPAAALLPLIGQLLRQLPDNCSDPRLQDLLTLKRRINAIDGSYFRVPADVLWGLAHRRANGKIGRQIRLDLTLDVLRFVPAIAPRVDGAESASESAAFAQTLEGDVVYLADRNFMDFGFLNAVIEAGSDFVVRMKVGQNTANVTVLANNELSEQDRAAGVLRDEIVSLPGSRWAAGLPGDVPLRRVVVFDPARREEVHLLTTLCDVPAKLIGTLYRHRWSIELFFRWLKCVARIRHLFSESSNGITMQFYVVIIATLLMYLSTGSRPSVYAYVMLASAARGDLVLEKVPEVLERIARERELERVRRARKKNQSAR